MEKKISLMDKAHIALDILTNFETECEKKLEVAEADMQSIQSDIDCLIESCDGDIAKLNKFDSDDYFSFCQDFEFNKFRAEFYRKFLNSMVQVYIDVLNDKKEG